MSGYSNTAGSAQPQRQLDVPAAFNQIASALDELDKTSEHLCGRLQSVTSPRPPSPVPGSDSKLSVGGCDVSQQLRKLAERICILTVRLNGQIELLEI